MKETQSLHDYLSLVLKQNQNAISINITEDIISKLVLYIELLTQWNTIHNLTAIRSPKEMVIKHILDSLTILPVLKQKTPTLEKNLDNQSIVRILDVGTGAGLPGIPIALCLPKAQLVLLDKNQKKINFIQHVILSLKLSNVSVSRHRVEIFKPDNSFDWIISRAFASLKDFVLMTSHLVNEKGRWLAMKGKVDQEELAALPKGYTIEQVIKISAISEAERNLIVINKVSEI